MKKEYTCQYCGKIFKSSYSTIKFCSKKCYGEYTSKNYRNKIDNFKYYHAGIIIFINNISDRKYLFVSEHIKRDRALIFDLLYNRKFPNKEMQEDYNIGRQSSFDIIIPIWGDIKKEKLEEYAMEYLRVMENVIKININSI